MSRTFRILLVAVAAVGVVGGYWKLVLAPKRAEAAALAQQVVTQKAQLAQTQALVATYQGAQSAYKANYATVVRLGKAVPADDDTRSLVVQIDAAAKRSGVDFDNIDVASGSPGGGGATAGAAATTPGAVSAGAFSAMPFNFSFTGDFSTLGRFFARLERFVTVKGDRIAVDGRLLRVDTIALEPGENGWPGLHATVGASSYIVPQATPATSTPAPATTGTTAAAAENAGDLR